MKASGERNHDDDRYTYMYIEYHFVSVDVLTMRSNCGSLRHGVLYVGIGTLQVGHS
jgi:hypothetical protein